MKVKIGCHYVKPYKDYNSDLDVFWQNVLLRSRWSLVDRFKAFWDRYE